MCTTYECKSDNVPIQRKKETITVAKVKAKEKWRKKTVEEKVARCK